MIAAHSAGIPVFVTGGIGGVHRGGEHSEWVKINRDIGRPIGSTRWPCANHVVNSNALWQL